MGRKAPFVISVAVMSFFAAAGNYLRVSEPAGSAAIGLGNVTVGDRYEIVPLDEEFLEVLSAAEASFTTYQDDDGEPVWVFLGYFDRQREGSQVHSPKHCYPGSGWSIRADSKQASAWGTGRVGALEVENGLDTRMVYFWFQTDDRILNDVFDLKLYLTKNAVLRRPQEVVFARVSTSLQGGRHEAKARLDKFARNVHDEIASLFDARDEAK